jgi:hypothetical protein
MASSRQSWKERRDSTACDKHLAADGAAGRNADSGIGCLALLQARGTLQVAFTPGDDAAGLIIDSLRNGPARGAGADLQLHPQGHRASAG